MRRGERACPNAGSGKCGKVDSLPYTLVFRFDEGGNAIGFQLTVSGYGTQAYWYQRNLQGDVIGLYNGSGTLIGRYTYDTWGKLLDTELLDSSFGGIYSYVLELNPIRYRGYLYDTETGLYYCQSRYYDPEVGRWLNADSLIAGTSDSVQGYNVFAYCFSNPINMVDFTGNWPQWIEDAANWIDEKIFQPIDEHVVKPVKKFVGDIVEDFKNYDSNNQSEDKVFSSNYFSNYKGAVVIKTPLDASFSFGFIGLSKKQQTSDTLNHEYGHIIQFKNLGVFEYFKKVAVPSVTINILDRMDKLPYDYYGAPWEAEADRLGGVNRKYNNTPWPEDAYTSYFDLISMFFS